MQKSDGELVARAGGVHSVDLLIGEDDIMNGGEGGIRTRVGVFSPQTAFEAAPLRPLRYLSGG